MRLVFTILAIAILFTQDALAVRRRAVRIPEPAMGPCPASIETPLFTVSPVAPEDFIAFRPLGFLSLPIHVFPAVIEAKTGSVFGGKVRTASPIGGTFMQDVPNTIHGNWFTGGKYHRTSTDLTPFLSFARDYVVPAQPVIAMGTSVKGLNMGLYSFSVASSGVVNRDFDRVTADGQTYCYEQFLGGTTEGGIPLTQAQGALMVALTSRERLRVEFVPNGTCATSASFLFTANATEFER